MTIRLNSILPVYFPQERTSTSGIWGKDITFTTGQRIHLVAPSGSGKTSLIHFLYGLRKDYSGDILFNGNDTRPFNAEEFAAYRQSNISIMFQDIRLFPDQTVKQNIEIKRQLNPFHKEDKIHYMAERLGIANKLNSLCKICSYGEQQRTAIIRSLMQPFDFLLLDEPFSHLDENNRHKAMELMVEESEVRNASIILADLKLLEYFPAHQIINL